MLDHKQIEEYIANNGVPITRPIYKDGQRLRVMDLTSVPASMREYFDERGFLKTVSPSAQPEESERTETKRGQKK